MLGAWLRIDSLASHCLLRIGSWPPSFFVEATQRSWTGERHPLRHGTIPGPAGRVDGSVYSFLHTAKSRRTYGCRNTLDDRDELH